MNINVKDILSIIEDILQYLYDDESDEYETNQGFLEIQHLFLGFAVKIWKGGDFSDDKYYVMNKILIKHYVMYY